MPRLERDERVILGELVPLAGQRIIELGCGSARLAREVLRDHPHTEVTGLEVDTIQHAKNLAAPAQRLRFLEASAESIPLPDAEFDLALMLKSLHHVPRQGMDRALAEVHRVLRPGGHLYVSEPVYTGTLNQITSLFNDEREVRAAAQQALDRACATGAWTQPAERFFDVPVRYADFADFERRMLDATFNDVHFDAALRARVKAHFEPYVGADGAHFTRPMHVRLLRKAS